MSAIPDAGRLRRLAGRLRLTVDLALTALLAATGAAVLSPVTEFGAVSARLNADGLPSNWASAIALLTVSFLAVGLFELRGMFSDFAKGATFGALVTRRLRRFTGLFAIAALGNVLLPALAKLWLAHAERRVTTLSLSLQDALPLLFAAVFYFVAEAFDQAAAFEADSKGFV
jgi:hypothetical protein